MRGGAITGQGFERDVVCVECDLFGRVIGARDARGRDQPLAHSDDVSGLTKADTGLALISGRKQDLAGRRALRADDV